MTESEFNTGWREGCYDARSGRPPVYTDEPDFGLSRHANKRTGPSVGVELRHVDYVRGYIGGFAAKTDYPPTHSPLPGTVNLRTLKEQISRLRSEWLLGVPGGLASRELDPIAEQHYLLALDSLAQAMRFAELAYVSQKLQFRGGR